MAHRIPPFTRPITSARRNAAASRPMGAPGLRPRYARQPMRIGGKVEGEVASLPLPTGRRLSFGPALLKSGCASALALAVLAQPHEARAQAFQGNVVSAGGASVDQSVANRTTITLNSAETLIDWQTNDTVASATPYDFLPSGTVATYVNGSGVTDYTVLNRITPGAFSPASGTFVAVNRPIGLNGTIESFINGNPGGNVWFYTPSGFVVGASGVFNVGGLVLTTSAIDTSGGFLGSSGEIRFRGALDNTSAINVNNGARINASSYVALVSPRIVQAGSVTVDGSVAYVAAQQADVKIDAGLFDINVLVGSPDADGIVHTGTTNGPASTSSEDVQRIYMVAVPKTQAMSLLLSGDIGFTAAASAEQEGSAVVLSAGYDISGGSIAAAPNFTTSSAASIIVRDGLWSSRLNAHATGDVNVDPAPLRAGTPNVTFAQDTVLQGDRSVTLYADGGDEITALGNLTLQSGYGGVGGTVNMTSALFDSGYGPQLGAISVSGDLLLDVSATGIDGGTFGGSASGGGININVNGGTISANRLFAHADAIGGQGTTSAGAAFGGAINVTGSIDGGSLTVGSAQFTADATAPSAIPVIEGSTVSGGAINVTTNQSSFALGDITASAAAVGGGADSGYGGAVGGGSIEFNVNGGVQTWASLSVDAGLTLGGTESGGAFGTQQQVANLFLHASDGGRLTIDGLTTLSANGLSADKAGSGGTITGGTIDVTVDGANSLLNFAGGLNADASTLVTRTGAAASADQSFTATGGDINLSATGDGTLRIANLNAQSRASTGATNASAGQAVGGDVNLFATVGGTVAVTCDPSCQVNVSGIGSNGEAGGSGRGGNINIYADGGSLAQSGNIALTANGHGSSGAIGQFNGSGTGGAIRIEARAGSPNPTSLSLGNLIASSNGDLSYNVETPDVAQGNAGNGFGGSVQISVNAGTFSAGSLDLNASGFGGAAATNTTDSTPYQAGFGAGGSVRFTMNGGTADITTLTMTAAGVGGLASEGFLDGSVTGVAALAGRGFGGSTRLTGNGGTLRVGALTLDSAGTGGGFIPFIDQSGYGGIDTLTTIGGRGDGGFASFYNNGSDITLDSLTLSAAALGGAGGAVTVRASSNGTTTGGRGGDASSGDLIVSINGGTLTVPQILLNSSATGGAGGDNGSGGDGGAGGFADAASAIFFKGGGTLNVSGVTLRANATGGAGGLAGTFDPDTDQFVPGVGAGGAGGSSAAGYVQADFFNDPTFDTLTLDASATGGAGGDGGTGGAGGMAQGGGDSGYGGAYILLSNGPLEITGTLALTTTATGGDGGFGFTGQGGAGGSAFGGISSLTNQGDADEVRLANLTMDASATGGDGGSTALYFATSSDTPTLNFTGAAGGQASGGQTTIALDTPAFASLGNTQMRVGATGGNGGANSGLGDGGAGGDSAGGTASLTLSGATQVAFNSLNIGANATAGTGGNAVGGTGGFGGNGTAGFINASLSSDVTSGSITASAFGRGGNGGNGISGGAGGTGLGSYQEAVLAFARVTPLGDTLPGISVTVNGSTVAVTGDFTIHADGTGGRGGSGTTGDGGVGGQADGGNVSLLADGSGSALNSGRVTISTNATGGIGGRNSAGVGMGGIGGAAFGGVTSLRLDNAATGNLAAVTLEAKAEAGEGGRSDGPDGTGALGGDATGGIVRLSSDNSAQLFATDMVTLNASGVAGRGGDGHHGGVGGTGMGGDVLASSVGGLAQFFGLTLRADGTGGEAGDSNGLDSGSGATGVGASGSDGGIGMGGLAAIDISGSGQLTIDPSGNNNPFLISASGIGGAGGHGISGGMQGGFGGTGGAGRGGQASIDVDNGFLNAYTTLATNADGTGGIGGTGGNGNTSGAADGSTLFSGGSGGVGGVGTGGNASFNANNANLDTFDITLSASGYGGLGGLSGAGGFIPAIPAVPPGNGNPGTPGQAQQGPFTFQSLSGDATGGDVLFSNTDDGIDNGNLRQIGSVELRADARTDNGFANQLLAGNATFSDTATAANGTVLVRGSLYASAFGNADPSRSNTPSGTYLTSIGGPLTINFGATFDTGADVGLNIDGDGGIVSIGYVNAYGQNIRLTHSNQNSAAPLSSIQAYGGYLSAFDDISLDANSYLSFDDTFNAQAFFGNVDIAHVSAGSSIYISAGSTLTLGDASAPGFFSAPTFAAFSALTPTNGTVELHAGTFNFGDDLLINGDVSAAGSISASSSGDIFVSSGANVRSDNAISFIATDDVQIDSGVLVAASLNPVAGYAGGTDPLNEPATLFIKAGGNGTPASDTFSAVRVGGTLQANGASIVIEGDAVEIGGNPVNTGSLFITTPRPVGGSGDDADLSAGCTVGIVCLGSVNATDIVRVGQATGTDGIPDDVILSGNISANIISIRAYDSITGTTGLSLDAPQQLFLASLNGDLDLTGNIEIVPGSDVRLYAGGTILANGVNVGANGLLGLGSSGDQSYLGLFADTLNTIDSDGTITRAGTLQVNGSLSVVNSLTTSGNAAVDAAGGISIDSVSGQGGVALNGASGVSIFNGLSSGGATSLTASGGSVNVSNGFASSGASTIAGTSVTIGGIASGQTIGNVTATTGTVQLDGGAFSVTQATAAQDILATASSGNLTFGTASAGRDFIGRATAGTIGVGSVGAGRDVSLTAQQVTLPGSGTLSAVRNLTVNSDNGIGGNLLSAGGNMTLTATNGTIATDVSVGGALSVASREITLGSETPLTIASANATAGNFTLNASFSPVTIQSATATGDIVLRTSTLAANVLSARRFVTASVGNAVQIDQVTGDLGVDILSGSSSSTPGVRHMVVGTAQSANGFVGLRSLAGDLTVNQIDAFSDVTLFGPNGTANVGRIAAGGALSTNVRGLSIMGSATSGGDTALLASSGMNIRSLVVGGDARLDSSNGIVTVNDLVVNGSLSSVARGIAIDTSQRLDATFLQATAGDLIIRSNSALNVTSGSATGNIQLSGSDFSASSLDAGGNLTGNFTGNVLADFARSGGNLSLGAGSGGISASILDAVGTLDLNGTGDVAATFVNAGGDVSVQGSNVSLFNIADGVTIADATATQGNVQLFGEGSFTLRNATARGPITANPDGGAPLGGSIFAQAGFFGTENNLTVTGTLNATGRISLAAYGDATFTSGARVLSDNAIDVMTVDDIVVQSGAQLLASRNPLAGYPGADPLLEPATLYLAAGRLRSDSGYGGSGYGQLGSLSAGIGSAATGGTASFNEGSFAGIMIDGEIGAAGGSIVLEGDAIQARGTPIQAGSLFVTTTTPIDTTIISDAAGIQSLATGDLPDDAGFAAACMVGSVCLGRVDAVDLIRIGAATGDVVPTSVILSGNLTASNISIRALELIGFTDPVAITGSNSLFLASLMGNLDLAGGNVTLNAGNDLRLFAGNNLIGDGASIASNGNIGIGTGGSLNFANIAAGGVLNGIDRDGLVVNAGRLALMGSLTVTGGLRTGGAIDITAPLGITIGRLTSGGTTSLLASSGNILISGNINSAGPITAAARGVELNATGSLAIAGATASAGDVVIRTISNLSIGGLVSGTNVALTSGNIAIGQQARVGTQGTTRTITLNATPGSGGLFIGGTDQQSGYSLSGAEAQRLFGNDIVVNLQAIRSESLGSGAAPTTTIGTLALTAGQTGNLAAGGSLTINGGQKVRVNGAVTLTGLGSSGRLAIVATDALEVIGGQGSIDLRDGNNGLSGILALSAPDIIAASSQAISDVAAATTIDARNARLGLNDGFTSEDGFLRAGAISLSASGGVYIQNSGTGDPFADRRGFTANSLTISTAGANTQIIVNGRLTDSSTSGGFFTGLRTIPLLSINGSANGQTGLFALGSTVNGCSLSNPASCNVDDSMTNSNKDAIDFVNDPFAPVRDIFPEAIVESREFEVPGYPPLIDEPVTGAGNDDLWQDQCENAGENGECATGNPEGE
ncbi:MAG: hypothetical protein U5M50_09235 [Sphingobium sp.]|nr:hypothetical protein [Sphingobium sp.]